jgi:DNA-binding transcriptional LysR family regulator
VLTRPGHPEQAAEDDSDLLSLVDGELVVELQRQRPDLFFLHSAVLVEIEQGRAALLVAQAGGGKSTTAWALLHHGFAYASDELAPVELPGLLVHPFPRALCLKDDPPASYPLPAGAMRTERTIHVPEALLPAPLHRQAAPLHAVFLVRRGAGAPSRRRLSAAEAGARLYPHALNALAHAESGLDAVLQIASAVPCFELTVGDLPPACELVKATLAEP